jgi:hypothetical protein
LPLGRRKRRRMMMIIIIIVSPLEENNLQVSTNNNLVLDRSSLPKKTIRTHPPTMMTKMLKASNTPVVAVMTITIHLKNPSLLDWAPMALT